MLTRNLAAPLRLDSRRRGDLIKSALDFGWSGLGSSPRRGHYIVFLDKTLYSHTASLHPGVQMATGKLSPGGGSPAMD